MSLLSLTHRPSLYRQTGATALYLLLMLLWTAVPGLAEGNQVGQVRGVVVDGDGNPLHAASIRLKGVNQELVTTSDDNGRFVFGAVQVGTVSIEAGILDLVTVPQVLRVFLGRTADVRLEFSPQSSETAPSLDSPVGSTSVDPGRPSEAGSVEEEVRVQAVAPLLDPYDTQLVTVLDGSFLEAIPVRRFTQSAAAFLPEVAAAPDGNPNGLGALRDNNLFLVDGIDTTDPVTGLFGLNLPFEATEQIQVIAGAASAEYGRSSGALLNAVTRSASNALGGRLTLLFRDGTGLSDYDPVAGIEREAAVANAGDDDVLGEAGLSVGLPLRADSAWLFAAAQQRSRDVARPSIDGANWNENTEVRSSLARLTARSPSNRQEFSLQLLDDASEGNEFVGFGGDPGENRANLRPNLRGGGFLAPLPGDSFAVSRVRRAGTFLKGRWLANPGSRNTWRVSASHQDRSLTAQPRSQSTLTGGAPHVGATLATANADGDPERITLYNGVAGVSDEERRRTQASVRWTRTSFGDLFDRDLRLGSDIQRSRDSVVSVPGGGSGIDPVTGLPIVGRIFFDFDQSDECLDDGDCIDFDPRTGFFSPDERLDFFERPATRTESDEAALWAEHSWFGERWFVRVGLRAHAHEAQVGRADRAGQLDVLELSSVTPRISGKYDARGDGRLLLQASYGQYAEPVRSKFFRGFLEPDVFSGYTQYLWFEDEEGFCDPEDLGSPCWEVDFVVPLEARQFAAPNLDLEPAIVDEWTVALEQQIGPATSARVSAVWRSWSDLWDDVLRINPATDEVTARVQNLDIADRTHRGLHLQLQHRALRWRWLANFSYSRTRGNLFRSDGFSTFADFVDETEVNVFNRTGPAPYDRPHRISLFGDHQRAIGRGVLQVALNASYQSGVADQVMESDEFGIRFLTVRGSDRLDDQTELGLSLGYRLPTRAGLAVGFELEVLNATNEQSLVGRETFLGELGFGNARGLGDVQEPRSARLLVKVEF